MAKEEKKYTVISNFIYDKAYYEGQIIILSDEKVIKKLLTNKLIK